jgi:hypothetical protein
VLSGSRQIDGVLEIPALIYATPQPLPAAESMQIVVLTCRKRLFTGLGAPMFRIEGDDSAITA